MIFLVRIDGEKTRKDLNAITDKLEKLDKISSDQKVNIKSMINANDKESVILAQEIINLKIEEALHNTLNNKQLEAFVSIINLLYNNSYFKKRN